MVYFWTTESLEFKILLYKILLRTEKSIFECNPSKIIYLTFSYAPNLEKTQEAVIGRKGSRHGKRCPLPIGHLVSKNGKTPKEQSELVKMKGLYLWLILRINSKVLAQPIWDIASIVETKKHTQWVLMEGH